MAGAGQAPDRRSRGVRGRRRGAPGRLPQGSVRGEDGAFQELVDQVEHRQLDVGVGLVEGEVQQVAAGLGEHVQPVLRRSGGGRGLQLLEEVQQVGQVGGLAEHGASRVVGDEVKLVVGEQLPPVRNLLVVGGRGQDPWQVAVEGGAEPGIHGHRAAGNVRRLLVDGSRLRAPAKGAGVRGDERRAAFPGDGGRRPVPGAVQLIDMGRLGRHPRQPLQPLEPSLQHVVRVQAGHRREVGLDEIHLRVGVEELAHATPPEPERPGGPGRRHQVRSGPRWLCRHWFRRPSPSRRGRRGGRERRYRVRCRVTVLSKRDLLDIDDRGVRGGVEDNLVHRPGNRHVDVMPFAVGADLDGGPRPVPIDRPDQQLAGHHPYQGSQHHIVLRPGQGLPEPGAPAGQQPQIPLLGYRCRRLARIRARTQEPCAAGMTLRRGDHSYLPHRVGVREITACQQLCSRHPCTFPAALMRSVTSECRWRALVRRRCGIVIINAYAQTGGQPINGGRREHGQVAYDRAPSGIGANPDIPLAWEQIRRNPERDRVWCCFFRVDRD